MKADPQHETLGRRQDQTRNRIRPKNRILATDYG